jgi:hypothetical protein
MVRCLDTVRRLMMTPCWFSSKAIRDADHFPVRAEDFDMCDDVGGCGCGLVMWYRGPVM